MSERQEPTHPAEWELVEGTGSGIRQFRQRVFGGWLVLVALEDNATMTYLPDPDWKWAPPIKETRKRSDYF